MHEMPGIADAIVLLRNKALSRDEFREVLAIALFHNGPNAGYWKKVTEGFLPDDTYGAGAIAVDALLAGTVYDSLLRRGIASSGVKASYPAPTTYLSLVHVVFDRLSQGTKGGVHKIWHEIKAFTKPAKMVDDLLVVNQAGTLEQLAALKIHVQGLRSDTALPGQPLRGKLLSEQVASLNALIDSATERITDLQRYLSKRITVSDSDSAPDVLKKVLAVLEAEEKLHGEPFAKTFELTIKKVKPSPGQ